MREMLFRGKRIDNNEWIEGNLKIDYIINNQGKLTKVYKIDVEIIDESGDIIGINTYTIFPKTLGEYVGLNDKSGNKVFEGDVIYYDGVYATNGNYIFIFDREDLSFNAARFYNGRLLYRSIANKYNTDNIQVIGNIYDDAELLVDLFTKKIITDYEDYYETIRKN